MGFHEGGGRKVPMGEGYFRKGGVSMPPEGENLPYRYEGSSTIEEHVGMKNNAKKEESPRHREKNLRPRKICNAEKKGMLHRKRREGGEEGTLSSMNIWQIAQGPRGGPDDESMICNGKRETLEPSMSKEERSLQSQPEKGK